MATVRTRGAQRVVRNMAIRRHSRRAAILGAIVAGTGLWAFAMLSLAGYEFKGF